MLGLELNQEGQVSSLLTSSINPQQRRAQKRWGIFTKKERWGLTWQGWLALLLGFVLLAIVTVVVIHPFLAPTHRVNTNILVVEGWVHDYVIEAAASEFSGGSYQYVFATGGPTIGHGGYTSDADTAASVGSGQLRAAGVPSTSIQMVPSHVIGRDRTYYSAIALRQWCENRRMDVHSLNIISESTHSRRTWLLFQQAFGKNVRVGIIAVKNPDYDASHWWRYSEGVREVIAEAIAYVYARMFFHPSPNENPLASKIQDRAIVERAVALQSSREGSMSREP